MGERGDGEKAQEINKKQSKTRKKERKEKRCPDGEGEGVKCDPRRGRGVRLVRLVSSTSVPSFRSAPLCYSGLGSARIGTALTR